MIAEKLRKAVLQAAIQGKLTEQLPEDGDARDLLKEIQQEKARLVKEGKLKKEKPLSPIAEDEIPFDIPKNWCWSKVNDIAFVTKLAGFEYTKNIAPNLCGEGVPLFKGKNIQKGRLVFEFESYIPNSVSDLLFRSQLNKKCLLTPYVGTIGNIAIFTGDFKAHLGSNVGKIEIYNNFKVNILEEYLLYFLLSNTGLQQLSKYKKSTAQESISIEAIREAIICVPPLAEQHRIVGKIIQILPEIDKLAHEENKLEALQKAFPQQLKNAILQAAIQGKLTEQLPEDGDARDLLKQIQQDKANLLKTGKLKKEKPLPPITEDEPPFDIPENWVWVRLGNIGTWSAGATPSRSKIEYYKNGAIPWLKTGDLNDGVIESVSEYITDLAVKETSVKIQPPGTILIAMYGATIGKLGFLNIASTTNQACCACKPYKIVSNWYLFYFLLAHRKDFIDQGAGGAQPNISKEKIIINLIPLPPLAEQQRIVERLEELLPLCKKLE